MDRLSRAEAVLIAATAHRPAVLIPGRVTSPMDAATTTPVPRRIVEECEARAAGADAEHRARPHAWPERFPAEPDADPLVDREMRRLGDGPHGSAAQHSA